MIAPNPNPATLCPPSRHPERSSLCTLQAAQSKDPEGSRLTKTAWPFPPIPFTAFSLSFAVALAPEIGSGFSRTSTTNPNRALAPGYAFREYPKRDQMNLRIHGVRDWIYLVLGVMNLLTAMTVFIPAPDTSQGHQTLDTAHIIEAGGNTTIKTFLPAFVAAKLPVWKTLQMVSFRISTLQAKSRPKSFVMNTLTKIEERGEVTC